MRKTIAAAIMMMAALSIAALGGGEREGSPETTRTVDESRSAAADGTVSIRTYAGSVTVMGWDRSTVRVAGTLDRDIVQLDFSSSGSGTTIETVPPNRNRITSKMRLSCALEVTVPAGSSVRVSSLGADVTVRNIAGAVECDTLGGAIDVAGAPGIITLRTLNGDIVLAGPARRVSFQTLGAGETAGGREGGGVVIEGNVPEVMGTTLSGDVRIRGSVMQDYDINTLSGTVTLDGTLAKDGRLKVNAGLDGSIDLTLPADVQGTFTLNCPSKRVDLKGFTPKAGIEWVFRNEEERTVEISVDDGASGRFKVDIETRGRLRDVLSALPRITLGGSFSEFVVGAPGKARVYLELESLVSRSSGSGVVLKTK